MSPQASATLEQLIEGNARFRAGQSSHYRYPPDLIGELAISPEPQAAVIACSDGRVSPEIIFDQPLGNLFVSRVPGNVASDSAKWMLEIAVTNLRVPLVIVLGHTECLAVKQVLEGLPGAGGSLRMQVMRAVHSSQATSSDDPFRAAVRANALQTREELRSDSLAVRQALSDGAVDIVAGVYDVHTGKVEIYQEAIR